MFKNVIERFGARCGQFIVGWLLASATVHAGLVAEYRFEESSYSGAAGEVIDTSGNARHGRVVGSASSTGSGRTCRGLDSPIESSSGSNAFDTGLDVNTALGNAGSISFWYYSTSQEYSERVLFDATTSSGARFMLSRDDNSLIAGNKDVDLTFEATDSGGSHRRTTDTQLFADYEWVHVVVTWHFAGGFLGSNMSIYVDGVRVANRNFTSDGSLHSGIDTLYFGDNRSTASATVLSAGGIIDSIRLFDHALSGSEVTTEYNRSYSCTYLHHLRLETSGTSAVQNTPTTFTVRACANASCSTAWTGGVSGSLTLTGAGISVTYPSGSGFSIAPGSSSTTVTASMTPSGSVTAGLTDLSAVPVTSPALYCGFGVTPAAGNSCVLPVVQALHHVRVSSVASGLTCSPNSYTITACSNADCSSLYTAGLTGNLAISGGTVNYPSGAGFTIGAGSSSTVVQAQLTQVATYTVGLSGLSVTPSASPQVYCGMGATPSAGGSCSQTMADSGLFFDVSNHVAGVSQAVTVSAVRKSDNSLACTPAFASTSKNVNFKCTYSNPTTGFVPAVVGGSALNAANNAGAVCDGSGRSVSLAFNASGVASTTVSYADAGQVGMTATYTGSGSDAGLSMTGTDTFIAVPASFSFSGVTAGPIKAGAAFGATVTAVNNSAVKTANFGRETSPASATLGFTKRQPTGVNSQAGSFTGSLGAFASGVATASNLRWDEVGNADLTASSSNYLGTGLSISGSTGSGPAGAVGPFIPNHFTVAVSQACTAGTPSFTYSGQPFTMTVTAHNATGGTTQNYDGTANTSPNFAKAVTLSAATNASLGSLGSAGLAASAFAQGVGTLSTQSFTYTNKLTAPATVALRAIDSDSVSSAGQSEGTVSLRSGRLRLFNAFGSEKAALSVPLQAHYWTGKAWVINSADSCTQITTGSVVRAQYLDHKGAATTAWSSSPAANVTLNAGQGALSMSAPTGGATGTVELAINLGSTATDQSCLSQHPASTGLNRPWLRSTNGSCATTHDRDPSARATFGIFKPETHRAVHVREIY